MFWFLTDLWPIILTAYNNYKVFWCKMRTQRNLIKMGKWFLRGWVNVAESVRKLKIGSKERIRIIFVTYKIIIIIENYNKLVIIVT